MSLQQQGLWVSDNSNAHAELTDDVFNILKCFAENFDGWKAWLKASFYVFHKEWEGLDDRRTSKSLQLLRLYVIDIYKSMQRRSWQINVNPTSA